MIIYWICSGQLPVFGELVYRLNFHKSSPVRWAQELCELEFNLHNSCTGVTPKCGDISKMKNTCWAETAIEIFWCVFILSPTRCCGNILEAIMDSILIKWTWIGVRCVDWGWMVSHGDIVMCGSRPEDTRLQYRNVRRGNRLIEACTLFKSAFT